MDRGIVLQNALKTAIESYQETQQEMQKLNRARQQFFQQQHENEMVIKELELLEGDGVVYKLIGPALVKQEPSEATANVNKRLGFIGEELKRLDTKMAAAEDKIKKRQGQIMQLQQEAQRMQHAAAQAQQQ